ncbi:MAG TPA: class I SAM-dependent methyltransferase [Rhodopila sp.]|uniref:class I SAM-dependent methyltransferase n=1 Tax=Rhodopila sp. TaxID=2480087 RepID=UPI002BA573DB|nr:class I SAM-dependent methyltransferase [Rhodopila sp.]HVY14941.1 class I SAM-dependent methyltransferase [Rhodopila sp.]
MVRDVIKRIALKVPALQRIVHQRDEAWRDLEDSLQRNRELEARIAEWRTRLLPFPDQEAEIPEWYLPPGAHVAAAPQRYTDNYATYLAQGGIMRHEDVAGFVRMNAYLAFDRTRFYFLSLVADLVAKDKLSGAFAELGVDKGNSASVLAQAARRLNKAIFLLDTYEGFSDRDLSAEQLKYQGAFSDTSLGLVKQNVSGEHVHYVVGYFPESAEQLPKDQRYCLVHLDCDLYKPFNSALNYFWPRLVPGGFLIMHDYTSLHWEGVQHAVDEFFADKPESIIAVPDMAGTVAVRKSK